MERKDDFTQRRKHLAELSDQDLKKRFWDLADKLVEPMVRLAETHTSLSIERSVLLRMGFSSLEARAVAESVQKAGLLGKGAGNVVLRFSRRSNCGIREAGTRIASGASLDKLFTEDSAGGAEHA
ncbi:MAG: ornithine aminomutase subunit alpha [Candidatus Wallbacteria bacterium]|nr:ornithine aminomutase subunit alpha [Candidatus Wallbacteria bacterium]